MGILDMFKSAPVATPVTPATPATTPPQQGNIPAVPTVTVDPNNPTAPIADSVSVEVKDDSPLAPFKGLWETIPNENKDDVTATGPVPLEHAAVQKVMAKADFSKVITPEQLAAITAGGEEAAAALPEMMNAIVREAMTHTTLINDQLTQKAVTAALAVEKAKIPALLREQQATDHAKNANPIFKNSAVKPIVEATQAQLLQKFPNATANEITTMTQDFIIAMGKEFAPKVTDDIAETGGTNWDMFIEGQS